MYARRTGGTGLLLIGGVVLLLAVAALPAQPPPPAQRAQAAKVFKAGNFRDALAIYTRLAHDRGNDPAMVGNDLKQALLCLARLRRESEIDALRDKAVRIHAGNWRLLLAAAQTLADGPHYGMIVAGEFQRGRGRGRTRGRFVNAFEQDRAGALDLLGQARLLATRDNNRKGLDSFYLEFARILMLGRSYGSSWRLTGLTDPASPPDFENSGFGFRGFGFGGAPRGAPVDEEGAPVFHRLPESYEAATTDGQRWRWALAAAVQANAARGPQVLMTRVRFLQQEFGVQTMRHAGIQPRNAVVKDDEADNASGPWAVGGLKDTETIARLATGIRRFALPAEFNFINLLKRVANADDPRIAPVGSALETLAGLYENRQQYPRAAAYWKQAIDRFGPGSNNHRRNRLDQIIANWGQFDSARVHPAGRPASLEYRFRNGRRVQFTAHRIHVEMLLDDVKNYIKARPPRIDYRRINIGNIGYRLVTENQRKYLGDQVATWGQDLKPRPGHRDRRITVTTPLQKAGAYLLTADIGDGNTSRIIIWISDTALAHKRLDGRDYYFLADATSGQPIPKANVEFFGYAQKRIANNRYQIDINQFAEFTDARGQVFPDPPDRQNRFQWLVIARGPDKRLAYLGFRRAWIGRHQVPIYDRSRVYAITDRPVYRPGQVAKFKFWIRNARYDKPDHSLFANRRVVVRVNGPRGKPVLEKQFTTDAFGGFDGEVSLPEDAELGRYRASIDPKKSDPIFTSRRVGGGGSFRVEEYKKPEFEVTIEAPERPVRLGEVINATIRAKYYFGGPVTNATVRYRVHRETHPKRWFPVGRWDWLYGNGYGWFTPDYDWYPGWRRWGCLCPLPPWWGGRQAPPELVMENEAAIGPDGTLTVRIDSSVAQQFHGDTDHRYRITAEVLDRSRRTIVGTGQVLAARKAFQVVTWLDRGHYRTGETIRASIQARTPDGRPVKAKGTATIFHVTYNEQGEPREKKERSWKITTDAEGLASLTMKATDAGQYRLVCQLEDADEHQVEGGSVFVVRGPEFDGKDFRFNDLELIADRREYRPGQTARLMLNTNRRDSTVLLFLRPENGVYHRPQVLTLKGKSTVIEVPVGLKDMPNFHVEVVTISDGRVHSVVRELVVPPEDRVVNVEVTPSAKEYRPGAPASVDLKLTDAQGKPLAASLVLSMYDKSVEYISGGSNVSGIREFFWKWRRRHTPQTQSSLDRYFGILLQKSEKRMQPLGVFGNQVAMENSMMAGGGRLGGARRAVAKSAMRAAPEAVADAAPGGGAGANLVQPTVRREFADTALWAAAVTTDKDGKARVKLEMPENLTTWKLRAWAMGHGTNVGEETAEVLTTKNVLVRLQAPRFFTTTDEVVLSANVHNYLEEAKSALVRLELDGGTLDAGGVTERRVMVPAGGEARVDWRVKVLKPGEAVVRMAALTDSESDAMELRFPVHVHGMLKTESLSGVVRADQESATFDLTVPADRQPDQTRLEIRYSPTLAGALVDALPYLVNSKNKSTEKTLNRFLPTVITHNLLRKLKIDLEAVRRQRTNLNPQEIGEAGQRWRRINPNPVFDPVEVTRLVKAGVKALTEMQLADGGWGWFSGYGERSGPHTTATIVHGLTLARANDVAIVPDVYQKAVGWLKRYQQEQRTRLTNAATKTKPFKSRADNIDALVFRVLVDTGSVDRPMGDFLFRDRIGLSTYGKGLLGLALHRMQDPQRLAIVMKNIDQFLQQDDQNQTAYLHLPDGGHWWRWYGNEIEANAVYLKLLALTNPRDIRASRLVKYLLNNRRHATYWQNTRDTALCIEAMAEFLQNSGEGTPDLSISVLVDGKQHKQVRVTAENLFSFDNALVLTGKAVTNGRHRIELRRKGRGPLYFNSYLTNFTTEDFITKAGLEIKVQRKYYRLVPRPGATSKVSGSRGQSLKQRVEKYDRRPVKHLAELTSGDLVEIELEIESKNDYEYLVFEDPKAAGFEPVDRQSGYTGGFPSVYRQLRDDRVSFFLRHLNRGRHSVSYRMRAETPGRFSALPTRGTAVYAPELRANSDEITIKILDR